MPDLARDAEFRERTQAQVADLSKTAWYHSIELPDGRVVPGVIGVEALRARLAHFPIPQDLHGKRVLDVGAATGWNSFALERRGAEVVAVDCVEFREFQLARELLGSRVEYRILDVDEAESGYARPVRLRDLFRCPVPFAASVAGIGKDLCTDARDRVCGVVCDAWGRVFA